MASGRFRTLLRQPGNFTTRLIRCEKLTGRNDIDRRVGYDFTFNASKSVSLAYTFANNEEKKLILSAFKGAVKDAMTEIETGMQARVRDKGKNENRETVVILPMGNLFILLLARWTGCLTLTCTLIALFSMLLLTTKKRNGMADNSGK